KGLGKSHGLRLSGAGRSDKFDASIRHSFDLHFFLSKSRHTASRISAPLPTYWTEKWSPDWLSPFSRIPMITAPRSVPYIVPTPPEKLVPPTTAAAMAF